MKLEDLDAIPEDSSDGVVKKPEDKNFIGLKDNAYDIVKRKLAGEKIDPSVWEATETILGYVAPKIRSDNETASQPITIIANPKILQPIPCSKCGHIEEPDDDLKKKSKENIKLTEDRIKKLDNE